jgi:hypothetical protein
MFNADGERASNIQSFGSLHETADCSDVSRPWSRDTIPDQAAS